MPSFLAHRRFRVYATTLSCCPVRCRLLCSRDILLYTVHYSPDDWLRHWIYNEADN